MLPLPMWSYIPIEGLRLVGVRGLFVLRGCDWICLVEWHQMLNEGVRMGRQGDGRVRAEGLMSNVDDIIAKLDDYLALIERRRKYFE
eukprot:68563-Pyramimonas_sp.AAC.1